MKRSWFEYDPESLQDQSEEGLEARVFAFDLDFAFLRRLLVSVDVRVGVWVDVRVDVRGEELRWRWRWRWRWREEW